MRRLSFTRLAEDRGAVAVTVALLMVVLLGSAAISIDAGRLYVERRELQNGADAAALAVAQSCAKAGVLNQASCITALGAGATGANTLAQTIAAQNANDGTAGAEVIAHRPTDPVQSVRIRTTTQDSKGGTSFPFLFGPAIGQSSTTVHAESLAVWGSPSAAVASLPIAVDVCRVLPGIAIGAVQTALNSASGLLPLLRSNGPMLLRYDDAAAQFPNLQSFLTGTGGLKQNLSDLMCGARSAISTATGALPVPTRSAAGGVVYLQPNAGSCSVQIGDLLTNLLVTPTAVHSPRSLPTACTPQLSSLLGKTIIVPIYAVAGNNDDLLTPGNPVPATALGDILTGIGSGNFVNGIGCTLTGILGSLLGFLLPSCIPPQPEWVHVLAFAGFTLSGYNITDDSGRALSAGNTTGPNACTGSCRGFIGEWTQVVSLNPVRLGALSADLTATATIPNLSANLSAALGNTINLGVTAVALSQ